MNLRLVSVKPTSSRSKKKFVATFQNVETNKTIKTEFGQKGAEDYTIHKDNERRKRYRKRHQRDLRTKDPTRAGYLSWFLLWNKPTLKGSIRDFRRRLSIYNKTGEFPID